MLKKTDTAKSGEAQKRASLISSAQVSDKILENPNLPNATPQTFPLNGAVGWFNRMGLAKKATVIAIAISTIPVLAIGGIVFAIANQSITSKISSIQQSEAVGLSDKVNRFMFERYGDIQILANLPILTNPKVKAATSNQEKEALLNKFVEAYKSYDSIAVFDLNGNVIVQSQGEALGNDKDRKYFQQVLNSDRPYISQPELSKSSSTTSIHLAAPVKDSVTGQTIAIVRSRMPVSILENVVVNYAGNGQEYHLVDDSGKFFLAGERNQIGRDAKNDFSGLDRIQAAKKTDTFITIDKIDNQKQLVSYASQSLAGLPDLKWGVLLATDASSAFEAQRNLLLAVLLGSGLIAVPVAAFAAWLARRSMIPILTATDAVSKLGKGQFNTRLQIQGNDELAMLGSNINQMAQQLQVLIKEKELDTERARLGSDITLRMRRSLVAEEIFKTAVKEIRSVLKTDRVLVYKFNITTWHGVVVAESVGAGWRKMSGEEIDDPCFRERHLETYRDGRVRAINNIYEEPSLKNAACYIEMLEKYGVKGNLIAPIITQEQLVGLLIAHHCESPRNWEQTEMDLFRQLSTQIGFAIEQAQLLEEVEKAKQVAEMSTDDERHQKEELQLQLLTLLSDVEGAASGDLTVRADVTAGEIGTVADFFNSIVESLRDIVTQVKNTANQVNSSLGSNQGAISSLAKQALAQTVEISRTLDAVDKMTNSMQIVAANAQQAAIVANNASRTAEHSGTAINLTVKSIFKLRETVGETAKKVKRLGESTQQISRVVSLINQIAMQTNLLAINAGIEAARAGEEGQGFAVVAEEVGELAARSASATKEIEQIVENIQRETSEVVQAMEVGTAQVVEGTRVVEDAKHSLNQILEVSRQIDSLVQSISTATVSQAETSQTVSSLMKQIASLSEQTSDSSRKVSQSLQDTVQVSQKLQDTVGTFKVS